jgi:DNA-binding helix-hairpin-helix protein with protein kinase domain
MSSFDSEDWEGRTIVVGSDEVTVGPEIDSGNEGGVYHIEGSPDDVVKIFDEGRRKKKEAKVRAMINSPPKDLTFKRKGIRSIIWPEALVKAKSSGAFLGYRMPHADVEATTPAFEYSMVDLSWGNSSPKDRFKAARNLAIMVRNIHKAGHAIGDFNDKNFLIKDGYITLIDCDAFHITDSDTIYGDTSYHPRYSPPEQRGSSLSAVQEADKFCLGVHVYQFLLEGAHPFQAVGDDAANGNFADKIENNPFPFADPAGDISPEEETKNKYQQLPTKIRDLFVECFAQGSKSLGWSRPDPIDWIEALAELTDFSQDVSRHTSTDPGTGPSGGTGTGSSSEESLTLPEFGDDSNGESSTAGSDQTLTVPQFGTDASHNGSESQSVSAESDDDLTVPAFGSEDSSRAANSVTADGGTPADEELTVPDFGTDTGSDKDGGDDGGS